MGTFKQYISETRGRLGLSIQSANKYLSSDTRRKDFLLSSIVVEQKSDGIKLTLVKQANTGRAEDDYILAHENKIIYPDEYSYDTKSSIRKNSKGISQLALVWEHLKKLRKNDIPVGTELFLEYNANRGDKQGNHDITLIGHTDSTWTSKQGVIITVPSGFDTSLREEFAAQLNTKIPAVLFEGNISSKESFSNSITSKPLKDTYRKRGWDNDNIINNVCDMFVEASTKEDNIIGVVIKYNDVVLKLQNNPIRKSIIQPPLYTAYMTEKAKNIAKIVKSKDMKTAVTEISNELKKVSSNVYDVVKLREDIQVKTREIVSLKMPGNRGVMFVGKFMELTDEHRNAIKEAIIKYDTATIALLSSKDTIGTKVARNATIRDAFPEAEIINSGMTSINNIINKSNMIISKVITENNIGAK